MKLSEAYGLAAIYSQASARSESLRYADRRTAEPAWLFPELGAIDPKLSQPERLKQLADLMTDPRNGRFARTIVNRLWHRLMGHGIVHPVDAMQTEPWNADLLDYLASYLVDNQFDLRKLLAHIANSQAYQSATALEQPGNSSEGYSFRGPHAKRMTAEQFVDAVWTITAPPRTALMHR